ncbi:LexA family protein [Xylocopilactobacillus apis]|uniref:HTH cro/C1-type domain-containing protein n=1 Tax=Xylocopilactobacillus apis TaxID=2932183 RepID=A0AAU9D807_9LACO|nr:XRE family transcriptional regulator [Xylocopilactobacillus apis]BDR56912.1 hypothetical protein KIMC2_14740 [Xylocopilactobacillus apis]
MRTNDELVEVINQLLKENGQSPTELAKAMGVSRSAMFYYLNGKRTFPVNHLDDAARFLHTSVLYLFGVEDQPEPPKNYYNFIDASVSAGVPTSIDPFTSDDLEKSAISKNLLGKFADEKDLLMMKVSGESMNRILPDKSMIGIQKVESLEDLKNGEIVVFSDGGDYCVKRIYINKELKLVDFLPDSTDRSFQPISYLFSNMEDVKIIGRVVLHLVFDE